MAALRKTSGFHSCVAAGAAPSRDADLYERYGRRLFRQALLTTGDEAVAEQVVSDVIAGECASAGRERGKDDTRYRLAESAFRRCQELAATPARREPRPGQRPAVDAPGGPEPAAVLSRTELGALALVIFGGLGYVQASAVLGISPPDMAAMLRSALLRFTTSSVSSLADHGEQPSAAAWGP
jgi:hypothetical protein